MSDPESPPPTTDEPDVMRPIPDGGLKQSMPEWLRRPPAWRDLPKKDVAPASEAKQVADATPEAPAPPPAKALPEADTSEIDPRSLVDVSDLPQWLQDLAARGEAESAPPVMTVQPTTTEEEDMTEPQKRLEHEPGADRDVVFEPSDKKKWEIPEEEHKTYGGGPPKGGMSQPMMFLLGVVAFAVVLILLFIIL